jgi:hypothetical protein
MAARPLEESVDEACTLVEGMCAPSVMAVSEAVDFLEDVIARLEQVVDAMRETLDGDQR